MSSLATQYRPGDRLPLAALDVLLNAIDLTVVSPTASADVGETGSLILADAAAGNIDMTLPAPSDANANIKHTLKKTDATGNRVGFVVLGGAAFDTGDLRKYVTFKGDAITVVSTGTTWAEI